MRKLFGIDVEAFANNISGMMNFLITKKTMDELKEEDACIKMELRATINPVNCERLEMQQGLVAGAIMYKEITGE